MEHGNESYHQREASRGGQLIPMSGDKEEHAGCEREPSESQSEYDGPAQPVRRGMLCLERANAIRGCSVNQQSINPPRERTLPIERHSIL
jgi:hypothetical protein